MLGFANAIPILLISRMIDGISGANIVTAQAAITDSTSPKNRAQGLGLLGAAFGLGFILGPIIAGIALALSNNDYRVPAFIAAFVSLLSIILTTVWFKETLPEAVRAKQEESQSENLFKKILHTLNNPLLAVLMILVFIQRFVFGGFEQLLPLFTLVRLGLDGVGNAILFSFVGIILVVVQGRYIGTLSRRFGEVHLIYGGLALLALGLSLISITPQQAVAWYSRDAMTESLSETAAIGAEETAKLELAVELPDDENTGWFGLTWILVALIPTAIGGGMLSPSLNSLITQRSNAADIGSALGVSTAFVSAANAITPLVSGSIFQFFGSTAPFLIGGVILFLLMIAATQFLQESPKSKYQSI
jgi:DHA1 family tetracycline resistance protein-like MFS transporter